MLRLDDSSRSLGNGCEGLGRTGVFRPGHARLPRPPLRVWLRHLLLRLERVLAGGKALQRRRRLLAALVRLRVARLLDPAAHPRPRLGRRRAGDGRRRDRQDLRRTARRHARGRRPAAPGEGAVRERRTRLGPRPRAERAALPLLARSLRLPARRLSGADDGEHRRHLAPPADDLGVRRRRSCSRPRGEHARQLLVRARRRRARDCTDPAAVVELEDAGGRGRPVARRRLPHQPAADAHEQPAPRHVEPGRRECAGAEPRHHLARPARPEVRDVRRPGHRLPPAERLLPRSVHAAPARGGEHRAGHPPGQAVVSQLSGISGSSSSTRWRWQRATSATSSTASM